MKDLEKALSQSRILLGTANYPSLEILSQAIEQTATKIITLTITKQNGNAKNTFFETIQTFGCHLLPNTAGCRTAKEAIAIAQMSQDIFSTNWIKLEIIADDYLLQPHSVELLHATEALLNLGFEVFPFCTEDVWVCEKLVELGCKILMPWGAPIGSGKGLMNPTLLHIIRQKFINTTLIIDAGIGSPLHAMQAILMGYDGILINTAVAKALDPIKMAKAFDLAVKSAKLAYEAGTIPELDFAIASTHLNDTLYWNTPLCQ